MDVFGAVADERRRLAELLRAFTPEQRATPSLCSEWTVQEVAGHLVVPLEVGLPRFVVAILASGGSFDLANARLARQQAERPWHELVGLLHDKAESRFTPPGGSPLDPLADVLVHGLDICWPLGLEPATPVEHSRAVLDHPASPAGKGLMPRGTLDGIRVEAVDVDWSHGEGLPVHATAAVLLLALTGRRVALEHLGGEGSAMLRQRLA